jgi:hypothetical protein
VVIPTSSRQGRQLRREAEGCAGVSCSGSGRDGVCLERLFLGPHRVQDDDVLDNMAYAALGFVLVVPRNELRRRAG